MKKETIRKILIGASAVFVIGSMLGTLVYIFPQKPSKTTIPKEIQNALEYINEMVKGMGESVNLISWEERKNLFVLNLKIGEQNYQSFLTKDGRYLFPYGIDLTQKRNQASEEKKETPPAKVEKRERPDVKLFVMSYCPFGIQMEKALLPVWELLGNKAEIGIYFVDYIMHGEKETKENLRQYCIQKEEKEKFLAYLSCFVKEGKSEECLVEAKIDRKKLSLCEEIVDKEFKISESFKKTEKGFPPFDVHKELNEKYKVKGSPTLVINDTEVKIERSPERVKKAICDAFLNPPKECEKTLSSTIASPGFGTGEGGGGGGTCQ